MHDSIECYLYYLKDKGQSPLTIKAVRGDLVGFSTWWETHSNRPFAPMLLRDRDVRIWCQMRQTGDGAAPATINRALVSLRAYCTWAKQQQLLHENPIDEIKALPLAPLAPKALPSEAVDAILRATHSEKDERVRLRDEALLALLVYAGLRAQETCDVQIRDLDLEGGTVMVRRGKGGRMRRVPLHTDAIGMLRRYLKRLRCLDGLPPLGSTTEREPLLVGFDHTRAGYPMRPGINQRQVQRIVAQRAQQAATRLRAEANVMPVLERIGELLSLAQRLEQATPHTLRHSLARRLLASGTDLAVVQQTLGHSTIVTTGMYLTPSDDELRVALERANV